MSTATRISRRERPALFVLLLACLAGTARADITAVQAQAMAEHSAYQAATFMVGVLGACASTYPDVRGEVVAAMKSMTTDLPDAEAARIISSVGRCMGSEGIPTRSQCSDLATKLPSARFSVNDPEYAPMLMASLKMLEPCRKGN